MNEKLAKHLDAIFSPYEGVRAVREFKEELLCDLQNVKFDGTIFNFAQLTGASFRNTILKKGRASMNGVKII